MWLVAVLYTCNLSLINFVGLLEGESLPYLFSSFLIYEYIRIKVISYSVVLGGGLTTNPCKQCHAIGKFISNRTIAVKVMNLDMMMWLLRDLMLSEYSVSSPPPSTCPCCIESF